MTKLVYHVYRYRDSATSKWPGYHNFGPAGFSNPGVRARLSPGEVFDTFTVTVNGRTMPIDQIGAEGDAGPYLKAGRNIIVVRVATTLNNRLAKIDDDVANRGLVQPYGLVGPVKLTPYGTATVWRNTR